MGGIEWRGQGSRGVGRDQGGGQGSVGVSRGCLRAVVWASLCSGTQCEGMERGCVVRGRDTGPGEAEAVSCDSRAANRTCAVPLVGSHQADGGPCASALGVRQELVRL